MATPKQRPNPRTNANKAAALATSYTVANACAAKLCPTRSAPCPRPRTKKMETIATTKAYVRSRISSPIPRVWRD